MKKCLFGVMCVVLTVGSLAVAGSFDATLVPNDARWIVHIDFAALRDSTIGKYVLSQDMNAEMKEHWQKAEEMLGMSLREDVNAVTLFGTGAGQDDGVMWIRGKLNSETLVSQLSEMDGYESSQQGAYTIHSWVDAAEDSSQRYYGVVLDETRGLLGPNEDLVKNALKVLAGEVANVKDGGIPVGSLQASGMLIAATADLRDVELPANPMLGQAKPSIHNFRMQMRENDGTLGLRLAVQQGSEQEAEQAEQMLNGIKMMGVMQLQQQNPEFAALLQAMNLRRNGAVLMLDMDYPAEKVATLLQQAAASAE